MASHRSAEEVEQQHLKVFGPALGPTYHRLYNEVAWLHAKWLEFRKLFAKSEGRIELLNGTAAFFFRVVQDVLWEDVLLHIARLTDPPKQGRFENLTLLRLPGEVPDSALAEKLGQLTEVACANSGFARAWRDQHIAHRDLHIALGTGARTLPGASRQNVEDALASLAAVVNALHHHYTGGDVAFRHFIAHGDGDDLVYWLQFAQRSEERQRQRLEQGRSLPEDFEALPEV